MDYTSLLIAQAVFLLRTWTDTQTSLMLYWHGMAAAAAAVGMNIIKVTTTATCCSRTLRVAAPRIWNYTIHVQ